LLSGSFEVSLAERGHNMDAPFVFFMPAISTSIGHDWWSKFSHAPGNKDRRVGTVAEMLVILRLDRWTGRP
jgi:hypothetical protein